MALSPTGWSGGIHRPRRANKMRLETKPYVMQDYDLTNFRFNKQAWHSHGKVPWQPGSRSTGRDGAPVSNPM
jgi:hypothetical protein